jgi:phosphoribosylaminoimidazole-succinocarboxamide synthase
LALYIKARDYAQQKGIIIADTKFEFGVDEEGNLVLADEVLTPDSSRFWPAAQYEAGKSQPSFDKQFLRDYLLSIQFDKKTGVELPEEIVSKTMDKYCQVCKILTGKDALL